MKLPELLAHLAVAHLQPMVFPTDGGGAVVVTVHGGRVLGVFTSPTADNLYFTNPDLNDGTGAQKFLAAEHVLGGDRLWLAPERGIFFKGQRAEDGVTTPASVDPGSYIVGQKSETAVRLVNEVNTPFHLAAGASKQVPIQATVERTIRIIPSPFADFPRVLPALARTHYAGYEIASRFELRGAPNDDLAIGLWFLIQINIPTGAAGHLYVPTSGRAVVTDYYEPTGADYLRVEDTHVRFKLDSIQRHKIGLRKTEVIGRAAYLSNADSAGQASLIVRNFLNNPSAHYCDVPLHTPDGSTQDSVQSYNHFSGSPGVSFGELEFHTPSVTRAAASPVIYDTNQVWCFSGAREDLVAIAGRLLNLSPSVFTL